MSTVKKQLNSNKEYPSPGVVSEKNSSGEFSLSSPLRAENVDFYTGCFELGVFFNGWHSVTFQDINKNPYARSLLYMNILCGFEIF